MWLIRFDHYTPCSASLSGCRVDGHSDLGTADQGPTAIVLEKKQGVKRGTESEAYPPGLSGPDLGPPGVTEVRLGDLGVGVEAGRAQEGDVEQQPQAQPQVDGEEQEKEEEEEDACFICAEKVKYHSGGVCGHKTCQ